LKEIIYRILIAGIDTLEIGYCISGYKLSQEVWKMLEEAKESAQSTLYNRGTVVKFMGYDFMVLRTGSGRYKFILTNEDLDIRIFMDARSGIYFPELRVRFKSQLLWRHGWENAVKKIDEWIRSWANVTEVKISRIDIMVDIMGELPTLTPDLTEVVTRAKKKREFGTYERYAEGKKRSGYRLGEGDLICRIYDKTLEILRSGKSWFEYLWSENGWEKGEPVTRVEFQCRRKIIRMMKIETIEDLFSIVPDLWKYLTVEWLAIRIIKKDSHRTRWPATQFWRIVQFSVALFGQTKGVSRIKQLRAKSVNLENIARGYMLNLIALASKSFEKADKEYGIRYLEYIVGKWIEESTFEQEIEKRRHKYDSMEY
jgi:hypothetical protein